MPKVEHKLDAPELFINRELSWLEFNDRVLQIAAGEDLPLAERLKFLSIVSSNLDEFFMIRVAGLAQQRSAGVRKRGPSGLTPSQQLAEIGKCVHSMGAKHDRITNKVLGLLKKHKLYVVRRNDWTPEQQEYIRQHFKAAILPVLTPLAVEQLAELPLLPNLRLLVVVSLARALAQHGSDETIMIPVPALLHRFVSIPGEDGVYATPIEDVIAANANLICNGRAIGRWAVLRVTRDADVTIQEDEADDLLETVRKAVVERRRRSVIRLEISSQADQRLKAFLKDHLDISNQNMYEVEGLVGATALLQLANMQPVANMKAPDWSPRTPQDLIGYEDIWLALQDHDVLLFHPYESFDPVVQLLKEAAEDPNVLAIKQTLYRTSGDSPIIRALVCAAENGKEVTVLVELRARFDESRNVNWARRLEDAGCHVIYGIAGLKTHAKALLVIRREPKRIRRYVHLSTGNYNDRTVRLYSDIGFMSTDDELACDVAEFFNVLTGGSETVGWRMIAVARPEMRQRFLDLIDREIQVTTRDNPGLIMAKVNSLEDKGICKALYRASRAGVQIKLNVRGICCLRPGLKEISENIEVRSIVGRFLEHARIFYFRNDGNEEVYLSSADWMQRNLNRRIEMLFPVRNGRLRDRLIRVLRTYFRDNVDSWRLLPNGSYERVAQTGKPVRAQEKFCQQAVKVVTDFENANRQFRPLTKPRK